MPRTIRSVEVTFGQRGLANVGVFPLIVKFFKSLDLDAAIAQWPLPRPHWNATFQPAALVWALISFFVLGVRRISHLDEFLRASPEFARILSLPRFPSSKTLFRFLRVLGKKALPAIRELRGEIVRKARRGGPRVVDIDMSARSTEGKKRQGATPGHNPRKRGRSCFQWTVATVAGFIVWERLDRGFTHCTSTLVAAVEGVIEILGGIDLVRLDGGYATAPIFTFLKKKGSRS